MQRRRSPRRLRRIYLFQLIQETLHRESPEAQGENEKYSISKTSADCTEETEEKHASLNRSVRAELYLETVV